MNAREQAQKALWSSFFATEGERAHVMAQDQVATNSGASRQTTELLGCWVGPEEYAIEIAHIQEIVKVPVLTRVPRTRPMVLGITSLRGIIVPVIETRQLLKVPSAEISRQSRILVLRAGDRPLGLLVDRITQVLRLEADALEAKPKSLRRGAGEYVRQVGRAGSHLVLVLDVELLLESLESLL